MIYHLATLADWEKALNSGFYTPADWSATKIIRCFQDPELMEEWAVSFAPNHHELILIQMSERKVSLSQEVIFSDADNKEVWLKSKLSIAMVERTDMVFRAKDGSWQMA